MPADQDPWSFNEDNLQEEEVEENDLDGAEPAAPPRPKIQSRIAAEAVLTGKLRTRRGIEINGGFQGNLECQDGVVIGSTGAVEGEIVATHTVIEGEFKGTLTSRRSLTISGKSDFIGTLTCQPEVLVLSENATFTSEAAYEESRKEAQAETVKAKANTAKATTAKANAAKTKKTAPKSAPPEA